MRERWSRNILALQARTTVRVPPSDTKVFTRNDKDRARFGAASVVTSQSPAARKNYSLLSTCYNEENTIEAWLESVASQTHAPAEVILVDGGSRDDTVKRIERWSRQYEGSKGPLPFSLRLVAEGRRNIAQGRNRAAELAAQDILAFSDAGCELDRFWAERLLEPFSVDERLPISMGWYRSVVKSKLDRAVELFLVPRLEAIDPATFLPSARSMAVKKDVFERSRGFPEFLTFAGEDSLFDYYLKCAVPTAAFVPDALAYWKLPSGPIRLFRAIASYARGDAEGGKLFALYYLNLLREFGNATLELVVATLFALFNSAWPAAVFFWISLIFFVFAGIRIVALAMKYRPFDRGGLFTAEGARSLLAVLLMTKAQCWGYLRGLLSRGSVERRRRLCCPSGHVVLMSAQAPFRGEESEVTARIGALLAAGYFVTNIVSGYPKSEQVVFEHQFLDTFLRSGFDADGWLERERLFATRERLVNDLVNDSLSKTISGKLAVVGFKTDAK